jgi:NADH dehydrogenase
MPGVAVLGGGYAGLRAARRLRAALDRSWTITLVERSLCHQLITRLPEIVGAGLPPERACIPYERLLRRGVHLMRAEVTAVDPVEMRVETSAGTVKADCLVVALGTVPDFLNVPGAKEYGLVLKSVEAATALRARIEELCRRQPALHIGIVGAGYTGTELAGELMKWSRELERSSAGHRIEVTVVAQDARLLPEGNVRLARVAESVLRRKGVALRLGTGVTRVEPNCIQVGAATAVKADLVIWATRARAAAARWENRCRSISPGRGLRKRVRRRRHRQHL